MKRSTKVALADALVGGALGSALSTLALMAAGHRESGSLYAPTNATSHWVWGDEALRQDGLSVKYTLTGYAIHHASAALWAAIYSAAYGQREGARSPGKAIPGTLATAALACLIDYRLTPRRLTPGFEHRLSREAMLLSYLMFAAGLGLGSMAMAGPEKDEPGPQVKRRV
ncbi:MAG: hypothetical protein JWQ72_1374 [Polaromonas sp.]|nr:hypothetical protein [Polaromonas sp.]